MIFKENIGYEIPIVQNDGGERGLKVFCSKFKYISCYFEVNCIHFSMTKLLENFYRKIPKKNSKFLSFEIFYFSKFFFENFSE